MLIFGRYVQVADHPQKKKMYSLPIMIPKETDKNGRI